MFNRLQVHKYITILDILQQYQCQKVVLKRKGLHSLSAGGKVFGGEISSSIGVTQSTSVSVSTSVSFTISKGTKSGYYRIETVFPGDKVEFYNWRNSDGRCFFKQNIKYAPEKNKAYKRLNKYA